MQIPRFRQRSLYTWSRRIGTVMRRIALNRFVRFKNVRKIEINGRPYKRVSFPDTCFAQRVASHVATFRAFGILPRVVAIEDRELLVEFLEGIGLPAEPTPDTLDRLSQFFATIYTVGCRTVRLSDTDFEVRLRDDLAFLTDVGVLSRDVHRDLSATIERVAPAEVRVGYDYLDAISKNFILRPDGRLMAIDIEDLAADELIGTGLAKALVREFDAHRDALLDGIAKHADFDLRPAMPFVELYFLAGWTKHALLKGRHTLVEPRHFERHR